MADDYQYNSSPDLSNWNYNSVNMEAPPDWLSTGNLASYFNQNDWNNLGYTGNIWNTQTNNDVTQNTLDPKAAEWMKSNGYSLSGSPVGGNMFSASLMNGNKPLQTSYYNNGSDPLFGTLINLGVGAVTGGAGGGFGAQAGLTGAAAGAANGALAGGIIAGGQGQSPLAGAATGALAGGAGGAFGADYSKAGITDAYGPQFINNASVGTLAGLARGQDLSTSISNGVKGAAVPAVNDIFGNIYNHMYGSGFADLQGSGGDMSGQSDVSANSYDESTPNYRYGSNVPMVTSSADAQTQPQTQQDQPNNLQKILSGFGGGGMDKIGSFASNHVGDLAQALFGIYNNRRQSNQLQQQMSGLQGLYSQNSPYAQQLRNNLAAKAAQGGHRSDIGAREVQLQAALADKAASMTPSLYQMQQGRNLLDNSLYSNMFNTFGKLGGWNGLQSMFGNQQPQMSLTGLGAKQSYQNMDNMYGNAQWTGGN